MAHQWAVESGEDGERSGPLHSSSTRRTARVAQTSASHRSRAPVRSRGFWHPDRAGSGGLTPAIERGLGATNEVPRRRRNQQCACSAELTS